MLSDAPLTSLAKKKRNEKTHEQYKKRKIQARTQVTHVTIQAQEVNKSHGQEVEHSEVRMCVKKMPGNHEVLKRTMR